MAHQLFESVGLPIEIADSLGLTARITQSEKGFRKGTLAAVRESDIVRAVNNLEGTVAAPAWAHTDQQEVRKLRMHLLVVYPQLLASREVPDSQGRYKALSDDMAPIEASLIATSLVYQKMWNPEYQFTASERRENSTLSAEAVQAKHLERSKVFTDILQGKSQHISPFDLSRAADHFFTDLGLDSLSSDAPAITHNAASTQGGR